MRDSPYKSDVIDLTLAIHHRTNQAVLVSETGDAKKAKWLPLSQVEIDVDGKTLTGEDSHGQIITLPVGVVTMPEWLAVSKGLV
jgi:hypothetical protein